MSRIESGLHAHHASMKDSAAVQAADLPQPATASTSSSSSTGASPASLIEAPFAKVNSVVSGSPADEAGLRAGDAIRRFGTVNIFNHEKLAKVAETVQRNEGVRLWLSGAHLSKHANDHCSGVLLSRFDEIPTVVLRKSCSCN